MMSDKMRSYVLEQENIQQLQALGIDRTGPALLELVRTGAYDHGRGLLSTARRVYSFMGAWNDLARKFLSPLPDSPEKRALQLRLARDKGDRQEMLSLLREDKALQERCHEEYISLLFQAGEYEDYLNAAERVDPVRHTVAAIRSGVWDGILPDLSETDAAEFSVFTDVLTDEERSVLSAAAAEQGDFCLSYYLEPVPDAGLTAHAQAALDEILTGISALSLSQQ